MRNAILFLTLAAALCAQTSQYPGAVDTNAQLFVTGDNVQTTLASSMAAGDAVMNVASSTGFAVDMIVTVCDAAIAQGQANAGKCTLWEDMLITGISGNVLSVTRGFAGTSALSHLAGLAVSVLIDAAHQQALSSAIRAIETTLGPNLNAISLPLAQLSGAGASVGYVPTWNGTAYTPQAQSGGGGAGIPCTLTALSLQYNNAGVFGCVPDLTFSTPHTLAVGASGLFDMHLMSGANLKLPGSLSTGLVTVTTTTGAVSSVALPLSVANGGTGTASPGLVAGSNVTIGGSWPNQTVSSSGGGSGAAPESCTLTAATSCTITGAVVGSAITAQDASGNWVMPDTITGLNTTSPTCGFASAFTGVCYAAAGGAGAAGANGTNGTNGTNGSNGTDGTDGVISAVGINGYNQVIEGRLNLIAGANVTVTGVDNPGTGSTDVTIVSTGGGGGGGGTSNYCNVVWVSSTVLSIASGATLTTPCIFRSGSVSTIVTAPGTATISAGSGELYIFADSAGHLQAQGNFGAGNVINAGSVSAYVDGVTAVPPGDGIPLWTWTGVSGAWNSSGGVNEQALLSQTVVLAGAGLSATYNGATTELALTSPSQAPATATDPGCAASGDLGKFWTDSASSVTTHFKVCANVSSSPAWVTVF